MLKRGIVRPGNGWIRRFLSAEVKPTVWWLERAILILSHRLEQRVLVRRSFAKWLVPYMINDTLRLDVITGFTRGDFHRLVALEDKVAVAWRAVETAEPKGWAARLAEKAGRSVQTVYTRQKDWLKESRHRHRGAACVLSGSPVLWPGKSDAAAASVRSDQRRQGEKRR